MAQRKVEWTATAVRQRRGILVYWTERNGSSLYAEKLLKLIAKRIKEIQRNPEAFKFTVHKNIRSASLGHFSILYKEESDKIIVVAFWDNRQNPKALLKILKSS